MNEGEREIRAATGPGSREGVKRAGEQPRASRSTMPAKKASYDIGNASSAVLGGEREGGIGSGYLWSRKGRL